MLQFELSKDVLSFILSFDQFSEWAHLIPFYLASFNSLFSFFNDNFIAIRYTWPTCKFRCQVQSLLFLNNTIILRMKNQQMLHLSHLEWQRFPTSSKRTWVCTGNSYQKAVVKQTTKKTSVIGKNASELLLPQTYIHYKPENDIGITASHWKQVHLGGSCLSDVVRWWLVKLHSRLPLWSKVYFI